MEEKGLQNKSILGNEIQLQDSETERSEEHTSELQSQR